MCQNTVDNLPREVEVNQRIVNSSRSLAMQSEDMK